MYVVYVPAAMVITKDFAVKFHYRGFEISATPRDRIVVYDMESAEPIFMALEPDLLGIDACKQFVDSLGN